MQAQSSVSSGHGSSDGNRLSRENDGISLEFSDSKFAIFILESLTDYTPNTYDVMII